MAHRERFLTVQEAIEYFNTLSDSDDSIIDICQLPPDESCDVTDEEDVNENEFEKITPADVCGQVEIFTHRSPNVSDDEAIASIPSTSQAEPSLKRKRKLPDNKIIKPSWNKNSSFKKSLDTINTKKLCESFTELTNLSPAEIFHKILSMEYLPHLSKMPVFYFFLAL